MWVVIEGPDGTGKGTVIKELESRFDKVKLFFDPGISHEPEHAKWQDIRSFIKQQDMHEDTETLMFFAMRCELMNAIDKAEKEGYVCICDRFDISTHIYQGRIKGRQDLIERLEKSINFRKPDHTFILSAPFDVIQKRLEGRFQTENANMDKFKASKDFRFRVWQEYEKYMTNHPECHRINADRPIQPIIGEILHIIRKQDSLVV